MAEFIFTYRLVSPGRESTGDTVYDSPFLTPHEFGQAHGRLLDEQGPPLPYPVELRVWAGADTSRNPDFVHVRRRRVRNRALAGVAS